jgi:enamine deaminase RidA (YjgF/YER057c/UK114 family)
MPRPRRGEAGVSGLPEILQPDGWAPAKGYANGVAAEGRTVYVGGQVGWNPETGEFESDDFVAQAAQALRNVARVLAEAGAAPRHVVRMTWYLTDRREYLDSARALGAAYREVFDRHFPAMSAVIVAGLVEERARVEIEATAVVPGGG